MKQPPLILMVTALFLTGCANTQNARFYLLHSSITASDEPFQQAPSVFIGQIQIPAYLERAVILTQIDDTELNASEFHRWAGSLTGNLRRVLTQNLTKLLHSNCISSDLRTTSNYRIELSINEFTGILGETARLQVRWNLYSTVDKKVLATKSFEKELPLTTSDYSEYVRVQSKLLSDMSREIAQAIKNK